MHEQPDSAGPRANQFGDTLNSSDTLSDYLLQQGEIYKDCLDEHAEMIANGGCGDPVLIVEARNEVLRSIAVLLSHDDENVRELIEVVLDNASTLQSFTHPNPIMLPELSLSILYGSSRQSVALAKSILEGFRPSATPGAHSLESLQAQILACFRLNLDHLAAKFAQQLVEAGLNPVNELSSHERMIGQHWAKLVGYYHEHKVDQFNNEIDLLFKTIEERNAENQATVLESGALEKGKFVEGYEFFAPDVNDLGMPDHALLHLFRQRKHPLDPTHGQLQD